MADLPNNGKVTADGEYEVSLGKGTRYNINIAGKWSSGEIVISERNKKSPADKDWYTPLFTESTINSDFTDVLLTEVNSKIKFTLDGSGAPLLYIHVNELTNG